MPNWHLNSMDNDRQIATLFSAVDKLLALPEPKKKPIGYIHPKD